MIYILKKINKSKYTNILKNDNLFEKTYFVDLNFLEYLIIKDCFETFKFYLKDYYLYTDYDDNIYKMPNLLSLIICRNDFKYLNIFLMDLKNRWNNEDTFKKNQNESSFWFFLYLKYFDSDMNDSDKMNILKEELLINTTNAGKKLKKDFNYFYALLDRFDSIDDLHIEIYDIHELINLKSEYPLKSFHRENNDIDINTPEISIEDVEKCIEYLKYFIKLTLEENKEYTFTCYFIFMFLLRNSVSFFKFLDNSDNSIDTFKKNLISIGEKYNKKRKFVNIS